jgi:hypothetical protein
MDDEHVHEAWSHALSGSGNIVEPIHSQVELIVNEGRLSYPATFGSTGAASSAGNDFFKDDADRSSNDDLSGFDESGGNVGSSTGLSLSPSRQQQDEEDANSAESC